MDKVIAKVNQNELDSYENFFQHTYSVSKNNGYSLTGHSYLKFKFEMVFIWAVITQAGMFVLTLLKLYFKFYAKM